MQREDKIKAEGGLGLKQKEVYKQCSERIGIDAEGGS